MKAFQIVMAVITIVALGLAGFGIAKANSLDSRLKNSESEVATLTSRISILEGNSSTLDSQVSSLKTSTDNLDSYMNTIVSYVNSDLASHLLSLDNRTTNLETDLTPQGDEITTITKVLSIGTGSGREYIYMHWPLYTCGFDFTVTGSPVRYWVYDDYDNLVLTGAAGNAVSDSAGAFVAAKFGQYSIAFESTGTMGASIITLESLGRNPQPFKAGVKPSP